MNREEFIKSLQAKQKPLEEKMKDVESFIKTCENGSGTVESGRQILREMGYNILEEDCNDENFSGYTDTKGNKIYYRTILYNPFFGDFWFVIKKDNEWLAQLFNKDYSVEIEAIVDSFLVCGQMWQIKE